jgi:hypothetical protein
MSTPNIGVFPLEEEAQRVRARIAGLEIEVGHLRGSAEGKERKNAELSGQDSPDCARLTLDKCGEFHRTIKSSLKCSRLRTPAFSRWVPLGNRERPCH